ncbi:MAG: 30S ribosomal protein S17 [Thermodesulfovibrionia bacterium]|nr:30S ribosomal protein S17 [Thermodesulfovibrionia bacterium]
MPKKIYTGKIINDRMDKTVVVAVERLTQHPLYRKTIKKVSKFKAHDEENQCKVGDKVSIIESRPLSRDKRWSLVKIIAKESR